MMRRENDPKRKAQAARTKVWGNKTRSHLTEGDLAKMGAAIGNPSFSHIDSVLSQLDNDHERRKTTQMFFGVGAKRRQPSHVRVVPSDKE